MDHKSKYREKLIQYIESDNEYEELINWIQTQPDMEQPDIFRELHNLFMAKHKKTGEKDWLFKANTIAEGVDEFEEDILSEKLSKNLFLMVLQKTEMPDNKIKELLTYTRYTLINCILKNKDDNNEIWALVHKAIKAEKESNLYNPDNWSAIM